LNCTESERSVRKVTGIQVDNDTQKMIFTLHHEAETKSIYDACCMLQVDALEAKSKHGAQEMHTDVKGNKRAAPPVADPSRNILGLTNEDALEKTKSHSKEHAKCTAQRRRKSAKIDFQRPYCWWLGRRQVQESICCQWMRCRKVKRKQKKK
jgi:hypothetical protein